MINELTFNLYRQFQEKKLNALYKAEKKFNDALVKYDAWWWILIAVLLVLSFVLNTALAIWCVVYQGKRWTGGWYWSWQGVSVVAECR